MPKPISKPLYWTPRILSVILIAFLALFSLDVFEEGLTFGQVAIAFLMHNIPVFVLIAVLVVAWKREIVGAVAFAAAGMLYVAFVTSTALRDGFEWYYVAWALQLAGPAFLIAYMFWVNWRRRKSDNGTRS